MSEEEHWQNRAACKGDPDPFDVDLAEGETRAQANWRLYRAATDMCLPCPVRFSCLMDPAARKDVGLMRAGRYRRTPDGPMTNAFLRRGSPPPLGVVE